MSVWHLIFKDSMVLHYLDSRLSIFSPRPVARCSYANFTIWPWNIQFVCHYIFVNSFMDLMNKFKFTFKISGDVPSVIFHIKMAARYCVLWITVVHLSSSNILTILIKNQWPFCRQSEYLFQVFFITGSPNCYSLIYNRLYH